MTADELLERLQGVRASGRGWEAHCPAHEDRKRSLTVAVGDSGALLLKCHAGPGCPLEQIVAAIGITKADLFPNGRPASRGRGRIVAAYDYRDEEGELLFQVVRYEPKAFAQRRPDGNGSFAYRLDGVRRVVYRLPELLAADPASPVYLVEGEKDADALAALGLVATTNPGGAGKWRSEFNEALRQRHVIVVPDADDAGRRHAEELRVNLEPVAASVCVLELPGLAPKGDISDWLHAGGTAERLKELARAATDNNAAREPSSSGGRVTPWSHAMAIDDFLAGDDVEAEFLDHPILARGHVTEIFSPRGVGKTLYAYLRVQRLARQGLRVLLLDRDNPRGEVKRRLRACAVAGPVKVMTRDQVPPLTDSAGWRTFPVADYDLVVVDALDSTAEGIGEKDSAKPSRAFAPLLDLARRPNAPAVLVLGNVVRSGAHSRGSGVLEDRADIVFEVRDATDFTPTGTKPWWEELAALPTADAGAWAQRATRRKRRDRYRIGVICTKFRPGDEPEPFAAELDLSTEPWSLRDVTVELVAAGSEAIAAAERTRRERLDRATGVLDAEVRRRAEGGDPLGWTDAETYLEAQRFTRKEAREVRNTGIGSNWHSVPTGGRGGKRVLVPLKYSAAAETTDRPGNAHQEPISDPAIPADRAQPDGRKPKARKPASGAVDSGGPAEEQERTSATTLTPEDRARLEREAADGDPLAALALAQAGPPETGV